MNFWIHFKAFDLLVNEFLKTNFNIQQVKSISATLVCLFQINVQKYAKTLILTKKVGFCLVFTSCPDDHHASNS